jgi:hypothetical protein
MTFLTFFAGCNKSEAYKALEDFFWPFFTKDSGR